MTAKSKECILRVVGGKLFVHSRILDSVKRSASKLPPDPSLALRVLKLEAEIEELQDAVNEAKDIPAD